MTNVFDRQATSLYDDGSPDHFERHNLEVDSSLGDDNMTSSYMASKTARHQCPICGKNFRQWSHFVGHINTHSGVKPFACRFCQKGFPYKTNCTRHEKFCFIRVEQDAETVIE